MAVSARLTDGQTIEDLWAKGFATFYSFGAARGTLWRFVEPIPVDLPAFLPVVEASYEDRAAGPRARWVAICETCHGEMGEVASADRIHGKDCDACNRAMADARRERERPRFEGDGLCDPCHQAYMAEHAPAPDDFDASLAPAELPAIIAGDAAEVRACHGSAVWLSG